MKINKRTFKAVTFGLGFITCMLLTSCILAISYIATADNLQKTKSEEHEQIKLDSIYMYLDSIQSDVDSTYQILLSMEKMLMNEINYTRGVDTYAP